LISAVDSATVTDLRPATTADAAILALHHYRTLLESGSSDAAATRAMTVFLPWARHELEAGRLIAVIAGPLLEALGSAALHCADRPAPFERAELLFVYSPDPTLEPDLKGALIAEARLRGIASILAKPASLAALGLEQGTALLDYRL
jgi:hypothetical protein